MFSLFSRSAASFLKLPTECLLRGNRSVEMVIRLSGCRHTSS